MSSALLESIALKYAKSKGLNYITDEARQYAVKLLGIDKQQGNPKYALSFGNMKIDPMRMIANQGIKSLMGGGKMGGMMGPGLLMAGALGLGYMTNPLREGSYNYNPELQGQIDYASGKGFIDRNNSMNALRYNKNSILSGQNVVSGFGTNDYGKQLQKYRDKYKDTMPKERLEKLDREIFDQITDDFDKVDKFIAQQTPAAPVRPNTYFNPNERDGGSTPSPSKSSNSSPSSSYSSSRGSNFGGRFHVARGGIASL